MDETASQRGRCISYGAGPHVKDHLPPDVRAQVERREELQGRLLCEVLVRVYEHAANPSVQFPADAALGVETDSAEIAAAVARAQAALASWR